MKRSLRIALYLCAWASLRCDAGACSLVKVTELPLIELGNHYAVMANVAGQPRPMIVDTGAATTLLGAKAVDDLNLKEFDFLDDKLTLYDEFACSDAFLPWTGAYFALPFEHRDTKIMVDIFLNGERTPAIVDTGNNASFVSRMTPSLWGSLTHEMKKTRMRSMSPFNGGTSLPNQRYQFDEIRIGDDIFRDEYMKVIQVQMPGASANLGLDFWKQRKLWISYPNDLIFVSGIKANPVLAYPIKPGASSPAKN
jgi:hypothetical protein